MSGLKITNLSKRFRDKIIFDNVDLNINSDDFVMLSGESGVGKTTLLNMIAGIEKPDHGSILLDNRPINAKDVGFVFQGFYLEPDLTIAENIELPAYFQTSTKKERSERIEILAKVFGIKDILKNKPSEISGGQAERACIARAIFNNPKIILADEPTNNLDEENAEKVLKILKVLHDKTNVAVIVSTHDKRAEKYSTRKLQVEGGKIHEDF
ncbi:ABC transporter ATP-binding protein [Candidatus Saccharibacteria bacterium]|nr:ABC transporter ATP-binding protein [Candidatus Saccharibacteria bacterium]